MKVAFAGDMGQSEAVVAPRTIASATAPSTGPAAPPSPEAPCRYGEGGSRLSLRAIVGIVAVHVGLLVALIHFDVIAVHKPKPKPLVVTLVAEELAPPPQPIPEQEIKPVEPVKTEIVTPPPIVVLSQPSPVQLVTIAEPPPPQAVVAAPIRAAEASAVAAPVTPPDGSAASLKNPSPRYPVESRRKREEGTVKLRVVITVDGRVKDIAVARSSGFDRLDDAALDTVRKWKFKPGMQAGIAVEAIGFLSIPFKIAA